MLTTHYIHAPLIRSAMCMCMQPAPGLRSSLR